jgi:hypothetical protein
VQCVVGQINALAGRRTHGPCVPTAYEGVFVAREALADAGGHAKARLQLTQCVLGQNSSKGR